MIRKGRVMNKILCKITGGHKYEDKNLTVKEHERHPGIYGYSNYCIKCGEKYTHYISYKDLYRLSAYGATMEDILNEITN